MINPLIQAIVGSTAYGLNTASSDVDRLAIFAYDTEDFFGLTAPKDSIVETRPDITRHEVAKVARLLLSCNPTVTELLWLPDYLYELMTPLGQDLLDIRASFLSAKRVKDAYMGYATQQFHRLMTRGDGKFDSDTGNRTAKHARHLRRLTVQGFQLYTTQSMQIRLDDPQSYHDFGEAVTKDPQIAADYMAQVEEKFNSVTTVLPESPDTTPVEKWLKKVRRNFYNSFT